MWGRLRVPRTCHLGGFASYQVTGTPIDESDHTDILIPPNPCLRHPPVQLRHGRRQLNRVAGRLLAAGPAHLALGAGKGLAVWRGCAELGAVVLSSDRGQSRPARPYALRHGGGCASCTLHTDVNGTHPTAPLPSPSGPLHALCACCTTCDCKQCPPASPLPCRPPPCLVCAAAPAPPRWAAACT